MDLKKRWNIASIIMLIFGITLIVLGIWRSKTVLQSGISMLFVGAFFFFKNRKIYRDQEKAKEFTSQNDERFQFLSQKSQSWAFLISITAKYVAMLVLFLLKKDALADIICYWTGGEMMIMFICYFVASKKY